MKFDPTKPVQTRDGRPARIICTDKKGSKYPIVALVTCTDGNEYLYHYNGDGIYPGSSYPGGSGPSELVNVPEYKYVNVYAGKNGKLYTGYEIYDSEEDARDNRCPATYRTYFKTVKIEV